MIGIGSLSELGNGMRRGSGMSGVGGRVLELRVGVKVFGGEGGMWRLDWNLWGRET